MFNPKSFAQIVEAMAAKVSAETPITDFNPGSVILTLLEAAAQEDFSQYVQMLSIIRAYNLDTVESEELDARASEFGLTRLQPTVHSGFITISDSRFDKVSSKIYAGLSGPTAGSLTLNVDDGNEFPTSGQVYIGRGTANSEGPIDYSAAPVDNGSHWTITLDVALINDHGTDETVVLSQFGNRTIEAGTEVRVPENDFSEEILFSTTEPAELLDGEDTVSAVLIVASVPGGFRVPANSIVEFVNDPFSGAAVINPSPFVNGRDVETDQELRDRIRNTVQALSRGTTQSIRNSLSGLIDADTNSSIVSTNVIAPVILADGPTRVYINNGRGLEPSLGSAGLETVLSNATGGEQFFQLEQFPVIKANVVTQNSGPFSLIGEETLIIRVGSDEEVITFASIDFRIPGAARATEISEAINNRSSLVEARTMTIDNLSKVVLWGKQDQNEELQIDSESTALTALNFSTSQVFTLKLYKNDILLTKDGSTASLLSDAQPFDLNTNIYSTSDGDFTVTSNSKIVTKTVAGSEPLFQLISSGDYVRFQSDSDIFYTKVKTVVSDTKLILEDPYLLSGGGIGDLSIWKSQQLEIAANGDIFETEIISFGPNDFGTAAQALASEAIERILEEVQLSESELALNNTRLKFLSYLKNNVNSKLQITGGAASIQLGFCTSSPLTGTLTFEGDSKIVTGSGTLFLTELQEGQWIKADSDGRGTWTKIESIEDDEILYLTEIYRGQDNIDSAAKINFSDLAEGKNRDYTFNRFNGQIELKLPLIAGDRLTAGSINTRAFADSTVETYDFDSIGASSNLIVCVDGGVQSAVTVGDASAPYDTFEASNLIGYASNFFVGFYIEFISGNNIGEFSYVTAYNNTTGELSTLSSFTNPIAVDDIFTLCQVIEFTHVTDFIDPENALASEVVDAINNQLLGGKAEVLPNDSVRIRSNTFNETGTIQIKGGDANIVLQLSEDMSESQEPNQAFVVSQNSDRNGIENYEGFTLGPDQNLVAVLDGDPVNKTFNIKPQVKNTVSTGGSGTFISSGIFSTYSTAGYFKDFWLYWTTGVNIGRVQIVTDYDELTATFTLAEFFPSSGVVAISAGEQFTLIPRTAENVVDTLNDLNVTTLSLSGNIETLNVTGDFVQISTSQNGTEGKIIVSGGSANRIGISVISIVSGVPVNDVTVNSKAGLYIGLPVYLTADGIVSAGASLTDFTATDMITAIVDYFDDLRIEFLDGDNEGLIRTVTAYNNVTGEFTVDSDLNATPSIGDTFRVYNQVFIEDIQGLSAPHTITFVDVSEALIDVSGYTPQRSSAIRDVNGLNFSSIQQEGVDGYKYFTGLIQKAQWTIDGLDRDEINYPGVAAAGTQFEVLTPVIVKLRLIIDVTTEEGVSLGSVSNDVSTAVSEYINSRKVGEDVILSEIIAAAQSVAGVFDIEIANFSENIVIADNEQVSIELSDLIIG